jgi:hypothetical protein
MGLGRRRAHREQSHGKGKTKGTVEIEHQTHKDQVTWWTWIYHCLEWWKRKTC